MAKYLDYEGLKHLISKIKTSISGKAEKEHMHKCYEIELEDSNTAIDYYYSPYLNDIIGLMAEDIHTNKDKIMAKLPRLKIGEDTSKIPNDSYYVETNEMDFGGNLADKKILAICERDIINRDDIQKLKDKNGLLIGSKGDFVGEVFIIANNPDLSKVLPQLFEKYLKKDFSDYIIVFGTEFASYAKYLQIFETIKTSTGSRNFVHVIDPEFKASLDKVSYDNNIGTMEMILEDPKIDYKFIRAFRGGDILRYKDKDGKIH